MKRLKLLWKFIKLSSKAKELELELQKIEQDMFNEEFAVHIYRGAEQERLAYKRGLVDGIKFCIKKYG